MAFSTLLVVLSFPITDVIEQNIYNYLYLSQMIAVTVALLVGLPTLVHQLNQIQAVDS